MFTLTPEEQATLERVVATVTRNDELRQRYKSTLAIFNEQPEADDLSYLTDSDDPPVVNFRSVLREIDAEILRVEPSLDKAGIQVFSKFSMAITKNFRENQTRKN